MIDRNAPLQVVSTENDTVLSVRIIEDLGGDFPLLAIVGEDITDPDDQTVVRFSLDGDSRKGKYTLENVPEASDDDVSDDASGSVKVPTGLVLAVRHPKYGTGKIAKVRAHETKGVLVRFDGKANPVWVKHAKLTTIAA